MITMFPVDKESWWNNIYDEGSMAWGDETSTFLESVVDTFPKNAKILDLGCGNGRNSEYLHNLGFDVTGIEFSNTAVEQARKRCGANFIVMNLCKTRNWINEQFDVVIDFGFYHFYPETKRSVYVKELLNVMKPGGIYINESSRHVKPNYGKPHYKPPQLKLKDFVELSAALKIVKLDKTILPPHGQWGAYPCYQIIMQKNENSSNL